MPPVLVGLELVSAKAAEETAVNMAIAMRAVVFFIVLISYSWVRHSKQTNSMIAQFPLVPRKAEVDVLHVVTGILATTRDIYKVYVLICTAAKCRWRTRRDGGRFR
jgi:hypothetical protein